LSAINFYAEGAIGLTDDTFVFTSEYSNYATASRQSIVDTDGGNDTINASAVFTASTIDLRSGGTIDGVAFTTNGSIENAVGGDGNDALTGTNGANSLSGMRGNDTLIGGKGADTLFGGKGKDVDNGGKGADTFVFASASDSTSKTYDTVKKADFAQDKFDTAVAVSDTDGQITMGALSKANFDGDLAAAVNAGNLAAHHAVLFTPSSGNLAGDIFLIVDQNGIGGYQGGADLVMLLAGPKHIGDFAVGDFI
jgi:Ca2+-binding RTX toxin-like protein